MDVDSLVSTALGGGLVLTLTRFVFNRLIQQVDRLTDKITKLEIGHANLVEKSEKIERLESQVDKSHARLIRLETMVKIGNH